MNSEITANRQQHDTEARATNGEIEVTVTDTTGRGDYEVRWGKHDTLGSYIHGGRSNIEVTGSEAEAQLLDAAMEQMAAAERDQRDRDYDLAHANKTFFEMMAAR